MGVLALAYGASAPQLAVAEFAPAARNQVEPPPTTAGDPSAAGPGRAGGRRTPPTTPMTAGSLEPGAAAPSAAPTTRVARSRSCVGDPPRQIDDPQSPPCLATIFEGENGGATWKGVTETEIAVAIPGVTATSENAKVAQALLDYFNQRFEFYGRRLRPVFVGSPSASDPTANRALAVDIASQQAFAALPGALERSSTALVGFYNELARQGVVSVVNNLGQALSDTTVFDELHPYVWSVYPSLEQVWQNFADFTCSALAGRTARFAGNPSYRTANRKFGIVSAGRYSVPSTAALASALQACGEQIMVVGWDAAKDTATQLATAMQAFKSADVTTVTCACFGAQPDAVANAAVTADYHPEWVLASYPGGFDEQIAQQLPASERPHMFALVERGKLLPVQARPWFQALQAVQPQLVGTLSQSGGLYETMAFSVRAYNQLLVLATGIQVAGPVLTPDTLAQGLMATTFSNHAAGEAPAWQPSVGFGPGDHSFTNDYALAWWDDTLPSLDVMSAGLRATGSWCYLDRGARFGPGRYPAGAADRFFSSTEPCR